MKKLLAGFLVALTVVTMGNIPGAQAVSVPAGYGFWMGQLDSAADLGHTEYFNPPGNANGLFGYTNSDKTGRVFELGSGLSTSGSGDSRTLSVANVPQSSVTNLVADLSAKQDALPSQSGQASKFLTTNGTTLSWGSVSTVSRSFSAATRSLNTAFQISSTRDASVTYGVDVAATISLTTGQAGTVILEYADDSGFTSNVVTVQSSSNGNTGSLTVGLNLTQTTTQTLTGMIPAGKYVRIRTVNTTGTPTFTYRSGQEVQL